LFQLCSPEVDGAAIHGAYFVTDGMVNLMRCVLRGLDRGALDTLGTLAAPLARNPMSSD
jgi:hypothetical protein